ncbi:hypothetical protein OH76DRAFT_1006427 [Lentinus brumalis]|uniref:Uncharacterized protein n=1 Tax=Lentinus brumalis TaxID=2498619 RepID=A0A371CYQ2_9APHY|nr:hypothetical protein OH76DRAFT_1006427 [Polyporus brumalis]
MSLKALSLSVAQRGEDEIQDSRPRESEPCGFAVQRYSVELVLSGPMRIQGVRKCERMVWMMAYLVWPGEAASFCQDNPRRSDGELAARTPRAHMGCGDVMSGPLHGGDNVVALSSVVILQRPTGALLGTGMERVDLVRPCGRGECLDQLSSIDPCSALSRKQRWRIRSVRPWQKLSKQPI